MTFGDVIKESVLEGFQSDISTTKICVTLLLTVMAGLYIFVVYRYKCKSSFYSKDFNNALAVLPAITASIILAMQSSLVISLGMVGALSIVRFRNAVKNAMDLIFLFWSISCGIVIGAGIYEIAILSACIVTGLTLGLDMLPVRKAPYLLVINAEALDVEQALTPVLKKFTSAYKVKSRSQRTNKADLIIEVRTKQPAELMKACAEMECVKNINLLEHDGECRG